jgi:putative endonuclease
MRQQKHYCVYLLASRPKGALYVGITSELAKRVSQHRLNAMGGHTAKYHIHRLVWYAAFDNPDDAITFEKRLKRWRRTWKIELIEKTNPQWADLSDEIGA